MKASLSIIGRITQYFVKQRHLAIMLSLLILILGVLSYSSLPKESLPEIVFPTLIVQTNYIGASALDVENLVTIPIENQLKNMTSVDEFQSKSLGNISIITVFLKEGSDIEKVQSDVQNRITQLSFPEGVANSNISNFTTSEIPLLTFTVSGEMPLSELSMISKQYVDELLSISGVNDVMVNGTIDKEVRVIVSEEKLLTYGINFLTIQQAINSSNISYPIGTVKISNNEYQLSIDESIKTLEDIENINIRIPNNTIVMLKDVADIKEVYEEEQEVSRTYNSSIGLKQSVTFRIIRENGSDVLSSSNEVKEKLAEISEFTSTDITILTDLSENVSNDIDSIQDSAFSGLAVVIIVLFLFIGFKESLIAALSIPLSLLITLSVLSFFSITLNTFAILGLIVSLGLLVDNSIIVIENIERWRAIDSNHRMASIQGANEVGLPILASTLTTVAAFFPLAILPGIIGSFINTIPRTIIITLLGSLVVSLTIVPTLYSFIKKKRTIHPILIVSGKLASVVIVLLLSIFGFYNEDVELYISLPVIIGLTGAMIIKQFYKSSKNNRKLIDIYQSILSWILEKKRRQGATLLIALIILTMSFGLFQTGALKVSFFPASEPTSAQVTVEYIGSGSLAETSEKITDIEQGLKELPFIDSFTTTVGGNQEDQGVLILNFADDNDNQFDEIALIDAQLKLVPGIVYSVDGASGQGPPIGQPIVIRFESNDMDTMGIVADLYANELKKIAGVINIDVDQGERTTDLLIEVDEKNAALYGLSPILITQQMNIKVGGGKLTTILRNGEEQNVRLLYDQVSFSSLNELASTSIVTPFGQVIPLNLVANTVERERVNEINRQNGSRYVTLTADLSNGSNAIDVINELKSNTLKIDNQDVLVIYEGEIAGVEDSFVSLFISMILAIFLVFAILMIQMKSVIQPFVILMTVPMALFGVIVGLAITGNDFGFYAFMGVVALVGIAVNDAIVLIDFMNKSREKGETLVNAIQSSVSIRFNPVIATTLTTIGGVLPLAFRNVYYEQFAYALIFGLLVTTLLTLLIIPILYHLVEMAKKSLSALFKEV